MKRYTVAQVRERLATALDEAAQGIPVFIERRGVKYRLTVENRPVDRRSGKSRIETLDRAVADGDWEWRPTTRGLAFKSRRRRS
jgi:hypothetical protein